jgi:hypothetical protein
LNLKRRAATLSGRVIPEATRTWFTSPTQTESIFRSKPFKALESQWDVAKVLSTVATVENRISASAMAIGEEIRDVKEACRRINSDL